MSEWLLVIAMSLLTFFPRYIPIGLAGKVKISPLIERSLKFVPIAVLTSIITQSSFFREGELALNITNYYLIATLVSFITARASNHVFLVVSVGMATFFLLKWLF